MPTSVQDAVFQLNQFVQFAEAQTNPAKSKAIARLDQAAGSLAVRTISVATDDKVYAIRRSKDSKDANNAVRDLFRKAVGDSSAAKAAFPQAC